MKKQEILNYQKYLTDNQVIDFIKYTINKYR